MSEIKKAVITILKVKPPVTTDDEMYWRPVPDGIETDGSHPTSCEVAPVDTEIPHNPLTAKGKEIMANMKKEYHDGTKKAKQVFYASKNKGTITGVD